MDGNLFGKHIALVQRKKDEKKEILEYIKEKTSIEITSEEIIIEGKKIKITTSSVKRLILKKSNIETLLKEKGYYV
jgi:exosome complex RNA-binding protein Rrp4